jgi:SH3-like domain-containing protein
MLLFVLILTSLLLYIFSRRLRMKKAGFFTALVAVLFFSITFSAAISRHKQMVEPDTGVIIAPSVIVRSSPSETGTELFVLHEGTKVKVNEEVSGWRNIRVIDGREGWITSTDFESI